MIYIADSPRDQNAFRVRAHRGQLRKLYRKVYTDDFDRPADEIVGENALAIVAALLPEWQISYSSAAVRGPVDGFLFVTGPGKPGRHLEMPGLKVVRLPQLAAPESDRIQTPTEVIRGVDRPAEPLFARVSTALQAIFECLSTTRTYAQKSLPDPRLLALIERLPESDLARAERFAARNGLRREYLRFRRFTLGLAAADRVDIADPDAAEIFFYGWRLGTLTYLGAGEYRFEYDADWPLAFSRQLPLGGEGPSYEGRGMPAFFENCLPEGWTESVVLASHKLAREDLFGLFCTTRKYLSNLTLRPLGIPDTDLHYDTLGDRLDDLERGPGNAVPLREEIGEEPGDPRLWRSTRADGPLRLSGVQAKLPVSLTQTETGPTVRIGDLRNPCTHILKIASSEHPELIENEWATMTLARRLGLSVACVAIVEFPPESRYRARALLVERYDIPDRATFLARGADVPLFLQEDACSLLLLSREEKYRTSLERVADALIGVNVESTGENAGMRRFLHLLLFSWIVGNGDLHAKNVSVLRRFRAGRPGEPPTYEGADLAPAYDLVNTRLHIPNDAFALPVDGRGSNIRLRSFAALGDRWGMSREVVRADAEAIVSGIREHLDGVLTEAGFSEELAVRYRSIVQANAAVLFRGEPTGRRSGRS